ncbi:MAG TPA: DUF998 domain-containing protein [Gammaproteobacteria bacterium]|jgi:small-conductance mechanosensitive channel|nr:DUF998 domain-containing protein [Gammaproteobacteria bacterium]
MRSPSPAVAGAIALPCLAYFFGASLVLQFARADYDWVAMPLSFYLLGPYCAWLILGFFALAAGVLCVALGLHASLKTAALRRLSLALFVVDAAAICVVALAHTDTSADQGPTTHGVVHYTAAAVAFLSVTIGMLTQSWRFRADPHWQRHFRTAFLLAAVTFMVLWVYVLWRALPRGAMEKAVILLIVLWLLLVSRWLMLTRHARAA